MPKEFNIIYFILLAKFFSNKLNWEKVKVKSRLENYLNTKWFFWRYLFIFEILNGFSEKITFYFYFPKILYL